ncbi:MAG TPA: hypothetical protein VIL35_15915 [Vicinamibacterales bacterium]
MVERAMWWPDGDWQEAHASVGAVDSGPRWAIADADGTGGQSGTASTYIPIANTSAGARGGARELLERRWRLLGGRHERAGHAGALTATV